MGEKIKNGGTTETRKVTARDQANCKTSDWAGEDLSIGMMDECYAIDSKAKFEVCVKGLEARISTITACTNAYKNNPLAYAPPPPLSRKKISRIEREQIAASQPAANARRITPPHPTAHSQLDQPPSARGPPVGITPKVGKPTGPADFAQAAAQITRQMWHPTSAKQT